jgi:hypothetical protein
LGWQKVGRKNEFSKLDPIRGKYDFAAIWLVGFNGGDLFQTPLVSATGEFSFQPNANQFGDGAVPKKVTG